MIQLQPANTRARPLRLDADRVQNLLRASPYCAVRKLVCELEHDRIVLRGTVPCFYLKQIAQSVALGVVGPGLMESDVEVCTNSCP
jgi:hypothetical protein